MQIACCDHILSDVFFASVEVATYAGNIIYFRPAVLVYSLAYSYTFSVIIVFYLVVFSTKMGLLQLPVWPQRCWCFKCHISAELKWERRIVESLNLVFFFSPHNSTLYAVCDCVCVCVCACPALPSNCVGMRQPSQLEGYLGTCVLRESPRANALGMSQHGHTHKHTPLFEICIDKK